MKYTVERVAACYLQVGDVVLRGGLAPKSDRFTEMTVSAKCRKVSKTAWVKMALQLFSMTTRSASRTTPHERNCSA